MPYFPTRSNYIFPPSTLPILVFMTSHTPVDAQQHVFASNDSIIHLFPKEPPKDDIEKHPSLHHQNYKNVFSTDDLIISTATPFLALFSFTASCTLSSLTLYKKENLRQVICFRDSKTWHQRNITIFRPRSYLLVSKRYLRILSYIYQPPTQFPVDRLDGALSRGFRHILCCEGSISSLQFDTSCSPGSQ